RKRARGRPYPGRGGRRGAAGGGAPPLADRFKPGNFGLKYGKRAVSVAIAEAEAKIVRFYSENGWPLARMTAHEAIIDHPDHSMHVTYTLDAGQQATFGPTHITALKQINRPYVQPR